MTTEYWANVYIEDAIAEIGGVHDCREDCVGLAVPPAGDRFRIHVRLKPEGAPKRYADEQDRYFWERAPNLMRMFP